MIEDGLIQACQRGDSGAFAKLLDLIYGMIFRFAMRWAGTAADAEDITQNVCVKLARVIQQFRFESAFTTWLYRLVVNCAHDWQRKEGRHQHSDSEALISERTTTDMVEASPELERVLSLVEKMGKDFKETLILVYAEGFSHAEAADILSVKESTISWRLHEIRKQLAQLDKVIGGQK